jgi:prepilin peptidase CpaA
MATSVAGVTVLDLAILTVFPAAVAFAGCMDLFTMTIPNRVSLALVAGFAVLAPFAGLTGSDMLSHLGAGLLVLAMGILLFIPGWFGGGDAKLAAAVALWLGFGHIVEYLLAVALLGGAMAGVFMAMRAHPLPIALSTQTWAVRLHGGRSGIPYGLALAAGALLLYPHTEWFARVVP